MPSSVSFSSSTFSVASAAATAAAVVRVLYTYTPKASSPIGGDDALNPSNYVLSGPGSASISSINTVSGNPLAYDLVLAAPLTGGTWTVTVANVRTPSNALIGAPTSAQFTVTQFTLSDLAGGAVNDDPERIIRKHLSPALAGRNWDALIAALSTGDDTNWSNAQAAFNQLFLANAEAEYLTLRAAEQGVERPLNVGLSDDAFRRLAIILNSDKLVRQALLEVLEVFYGKESLRGYVESIAAPFNLSDSPVLSVLVDEVDEVDVTLDAATFAVSSAATALEVAVTINKALREAGSAAFAVPVVDAATNEDRVRIYSGKLGLSSSVRITGKNAQLQLQFPSLIETYSGTVTTGLGYSWTWSNPSPAVSRASLTATGAGLLVSLLDVQEGDYVVIGSESQLAFTGTYEVLNVSYSWSGANVVQFFEIADVDFVGSAVQAGNDAYRFFRPEKRTSASTGSRAVVVSATAGHGLDITIPATSEVVSRGLNQAAYLQPFTSLGIARAVRVGTTLSIETESAHGLTATDIFEVADLRSSRSRPFISPGNGAAAPSAYTFPASHSSLALNSQANITLPANGVAIKMSNDQVLFAGGFTAAGGTYSAESALCSRYVPASTTVVADGTEANGATRYGHSWLTVPSLPVARQGLGGTPYELLGTPSALVSGGYDESTESFLSSCYTYTAGGGSWTTIASLGTAVAGHLQALVNGVETVVFGGARTIGTASNAVYKFTTNSWLAQTAMPVPLVDMSASPLSSGSILLTGGRLLGQASILDDATMALWRLDDTGGTLVDAVGTHDLSSGSSTSITNGKIERARSFSAGTATGSGNATSRGVLLDQWTIEMWYRCDSTGGAERAFISFGGPTGAGGDNRLVEIYLNTSNEIVVEWENGSGNVQTYNSVVAMDGPPAVVNSTPTWNHLAVRKTIGSVILLEFFINGQLRTSIEIDTGESPTGGGSADWVLGDSAKGGRAYDGDLDDIRISDGANGPRSDGQILETFLRGWGHYIGTTRTQPVGLVSDRAWVTNGSTWTETGRMKYGRAWHQTTTLPSGEVLVTGGIGHPPGQLDVPFYNTATGRDQAAIWPNAILNQAEIWSPTTGRWELLPAMKHARYGHVAQYDAATNTVIVMGGSAEYPNYAVSGSNPQVVEVFDVATRTWSAATHALPSRRTIARGALTQGALVVAGFDGLSTITTAGVYLPGYNTLTAPLNGTYRVATVPSSTQLTATVANLGYGSNMSASSQTPFVLGGLWTITSAQRTSNVTTLTLSIPSTAVHGIAVNDRVFVNSTVAGYGSGVKTVLSVTSTTITYSDVASDLGPTAFSAGQGSVSQRTSAGALIASAAAATAANSTGPFVWDTSGNVGIDSTTVTTAALLSNTQYNEISVADATSFADAGWIVLGFGGAQQSEPIKYTAKYTVGGTTKLKLDFSATMPFSYATGTTVDEVIELSDYAPADPTAVGSMYITDSSSARVAAQKTMEDITAAGVDLNINVTYPGDRGLGAEGAPTSGAPRLSDLVEIYSGGN